MKARGRPIDPKAKDRRSRCIRVTDAEYEKIMRAIKKLREESKPTN